MGILESMRTGTDSTFMQVVMAGLILAFVGMYSNPGGDRVNTVAVVNGEAILDTDFSRAYGNALRSREAESGRSLSDVEQKRLSDEVKSSLIEREVMLQEAHRLGIEVSDSEIARQLLELSFLKGENGKFDPELYAKWLKRQHRTKADFEESLRDDLALYKLQTLVAIGASTSEPAIREAWSEAGTTVDLKLVRIRPSAFDKELQFTPEERAKWITENDALIQQTYDRDKARLYDHPEQVRLRMIRLAIRPEGPDVAELVPRLNKLRDRIAAGEDMVALAKAWSEDPSVHEGGDLGLRPVAQLPTEVAAAVSGLEPNGLSQVLTSATDVRLVRLEERVAPKVDELAEVKDAIADQLMRAEELPKRAQRFAEDELLPKWKETAAVPEDLLAAHGLSATDTGPLKLNEAQRNPFAPPKPVLEAVAKLEVGAVLPEVVESGGTLFVAQLVSRELPDAAEFDANRATIAAQFLAERRSTFFQDWISDRKASAKIE